MYVRPKLTFVSFFMFFFLHLPLSIFCCILSRWPMATALCVFGKRGPKMFNFELLFLHGFSSKNREILHKAVLTPQEYEDYFFRKKN